MKITSATILFLLILCNTVFAEYKDPRDPNSLKYLQPEVGLLNDEKWKVDYEYEIKKAFDKALNTDLCLKMVCLPSFQKEWLVGIKDDNNKKTVFLLTAKEHIWGYYLKKEKSSRLNSTVTQKAKEDSDKTIDIENKSIEIDSNTAELLSEVWTQMLLKTQHTKNYRIGMDGANYHFYILGIGGQVWSPIKDTNTGRLVEIGELLADYVKADVGKRKDILKTIQTKAEELQKKLKDEESPQPIPPTLPSPAGGEGKK